MIAEATALPVVRSSTREVGMLRMFNLDQRLLVLMRDTSNPRGQRAKVSVS